MSLTIDLPEELEKELSAEASRLGLPLSEYALRLLATGGSHAFGAGADAPKTGAELVAYWHSEGVIGTRPDIADSLQYAQELRQKAERRTQE
jgi:hypothetical protein